MAASRIFLRGLNAIALDCLNPEANWKIRVCFGLLDAFLDRQKDRLQIVPVWDCDHVPTEAAERLESALHAEGIFGDASGKLRVVVRHNHHKWIHPIFGRKS